MKIIAKPRRSARTTAIVRRASKYRSIIICSNVRMKRLLVDIANEENCEIPSPVTMYEAVHGGLAGRHEGSVIIDDMEACLFSIIPLPIDVVVCYTESFKE